MIIDNLIIKNIIKLKSFAFVSRVVKLYQNLIEKKKEYVLSKQLLLTGTSIGPVLQLSIELMSFSPAKPIITIGEKHQSKK